MGQDGNTRLKNDLYRSTSKKVIHNIPLSQYIWLETYGDVKSVEFRISSASGMGRVFRINNIVFNYSGSDKAKAISREMEEINASGCGYYSFLAKPSIEDPRYLIMCIFDTNKSKLYVVDAHL